MRGPKDETSIGAPKRRCIGCGLVADQAALRRFAASDGRAVPDAERRMPGRGAYVCSDECIERATLRRAWGRAFRAPVQPPLDG